ncbi:Glucose-methanol-choline oxidoreductase [Penicillium cf. griseofulvum]|uniref:Glucose-methanol-choline oxidoreductase n=1 Tax=Penicillium cf. griseofulvum TaxID=2972120 RepID=A0A9W9M192_9EURO|nr:Glucose-methanol-choline oxidoreductase [Penicillium cf. griseofulvum]KAJ5429707.1 Glucose-methanol-choline oxidoreductase [Penicillium cf. griseofulvum]KAJ5436526.1 Glucose-methanol-choline oxidoreductase [Penicillium cf. griseofulvum]
MWPFSTYPEKTAGDVAGKTFDYIIVGGGTAGCLIAHRLSASPNVSILVLDKGRVNAGLLSRIPLLGILQSGVVRYHAEPNDHLRGRHVQLLAGELLGGSSRVHSMTWSPGGRPEFDGWARELGLDEWSWEKVLPAFERVEKGIQRKVAGDLRLMPYVDAAMEGVGLGDGGRKRGTQRYNRSEVSVDADGNRVSALTAWLNASVVNERKGRLTVCTGVTAAKLEFSDDGRRVTGVWINPGMGADVLVNAQQEVILCSGVFGTPQLLMQSGIGPKEHLSAHKIPVVHDLPAVGAHLTTHILVPVMTELPLKHTLHIVQTVAILWHFLLWLFSGTGVLASNGQWGAAFLHSDMLNEATMTVVPPEAGEKEVTDLEILICPISTLIEHGVPGVPCMTWYAALVQPYTTGTVELSSGSDAKAPLKITLPLLIDTRDSARLRKAVRFAMRLADEFTGPEVGYPHPARLTMAPGMGLEYLDVLLDKTKSKSDKRKLTKMLPPQRDAWRTVTDTEIDEYIKRLVTGSYDPAGTCRMSLTKEEGVVDQSLKVYGVHNLRIADASVLPRCGGASISASIYMIGERCAEFVMKQNGFPS